LYQRALHYLPGSYKLWFNFLRESKKYVKKTYHEHLEKGESLVEVVSDIFERALVYMSKMPKIWLDYAKFLGKQAGSVTLTREVYDRALLALPVTQHQLVWNQALDWACSLEDYTATACHFYRRYIELRPQDTEDYIDYLLKNDLLEEAL
jgi:pre-mRNA-splicing factor SYF1